VTCDNVDATLLHEVIEPRKLAAIAVPQKVPFAPVTAAAPRIDETGKVVTNAVIAAIRCLYWSIRLRHRTVSETRTFAS
jgi:hypothetical protein